MTFNKSLQQTIADITIWRKDEQRAPYKPLLLFHVLTEYQQGHDRLSDYGSETRALLHSLLERFGPQHARYRPDMPFWRLQDDGFWGLQNTEHRSAPSSGKQPPTGELVTHNIAGGFDKQHFTLLKKSKNLINTLVQQTLEARLTEGIQEEIADRLGFDILQTHRQRDPSFHQQVLHTYNHKRATCGFDMRHGSTSVVLETTHIKWRQHGGPCEVSNGPALCVIHHEAFNKGSIRLDESMQAQMSPVVSGSGMVGRLLWNFDDKSIALPMMRKNYPKEGFVEWRRREVFKR